MDFNFAARTCGGKAKVRGEVVVILIDVAALQVWRFRSVVAFDQECKVIDKEFFSNYGFVVARGVFQLGEIEEFRQRLTKSKLRALKEGAAYSTDAAESVPVV